MFGGTCSVLHNCSLVCNVVFMLEWCFLQFREELKPTWGIWKLEFNCCVCNQPGPEVSDYRPPSHCYVFSTHPPGHYSGFKIFCQCPFIRPKCIRKGTKLPCHSQGSKNNSSEGFFCPILSSICVLAGYRAGFGRLPHPPTHPRGCYMAGIQCFLYAFMLSKASGANEPCRVGQSVTPSLKGRQNMPLC